MQLVLKCYKTTLKYILKAFCLKILIADDARTIRETLKYYLGLLHVTDIDEVENGKDAVIMCENNDYDLVFMDVTMPILDGISATRFIKKIKKDVAIVCVSADRKTETINNIIKSGAEDYIVKPLNPQLIKQRLSNYIKLIENRKIISTRRNAINLFNFPCYSYFTAFKVSAEDDLALFYDHMVNAYQKECSYEQDCACTVKLAMSAVTTIGNILLKMSLKFLVIIEQHENGFYFSMTHIHSLSKNIIEEIIKREIEPAIDLMQYKIELNKLSISAPFVQDKKIEEDVAPVLQAYTPVEQEAKELHVYDFIEQDDLVELVDNINELESMLGILQYSTLSESDAARVVDLINKLGVCLSGYNETFNISVALKNLTVDIQNNIETFIDKSKTMATIFMSFSHDIKEWQDSLFHKGATSVGFMDDTIITNASYISNLVKPVEKSSDSEDLDDIFSF